MVTGSLGASAYWSGLSTRRRCQRWNAVGWNSTSGGGVRQRRGSRGAGWGGWTWSRRSPARAQHDPPWTEDLDAAPLPKGRARRRRPATSVQPRRDARRGSAVYRRSRHARLPRAPALVGVEEPRQAGCRLAEDGRQQSSANSVRRLLPTLGYSRQSNRKRGRGLEASPIVHAQFEHINAKVVVAQAEGQPVISVDTKKKELIGNYKNGGTDYRPQGDPRRVNVHDFEDEELGKIVPYGVYDLEPQRRLGQRRDHD